MRSILEARRWLPMLAAVLLIVGCEGQAGTDGVAGPGGKAGVAGTAGDKGATGETGLAGANGAAGAAGAKGDTGAAGAAGAKGDTGAAGAKGDKGDKGDSGVAGAKGATGVAGAAGAKGATGVAGAAGAKGATGATGAKGDPGGDPVVVPTEGIAGVVTDAAKMLVTSGTIWFVPAADVDNLPATTVAANSDNDEPLEDLVAKNASKYLKATIDKKGRYSVTKLPVGKWFVTFMPAATDKGHLPGGDLCRDAMTNTQLKGGQFDIRVSSATPAGATYIGSGSCVACHGKQHVGQTMHRLGIWSPYEHGLLQDQSVRSDDLYMGLNKFTAAGTKIYYSSYDATRGFDRYKTSLTDPGKDVSLTVTLRKKNGKYQMVITNVKNPNDPNSPLVRDVDLVYGGGIYKQRYITRQIIGNDFNHAILPVQFQHKGKEDATHGRTSKVFRDYHANFWYSEADAKILTVVPPNHSFEKNCLSCHASGAKISGSDSTNWKASVVSDPLWGDFDYDGDGILDEMNVGCESCHGPGSAHLNATGQGRFIVSPALLTPSRETMICGRCHSRPKGVFGSDNPVNKDGMMMVAGASRATFLKDYATTEMDGAAKDYWKDAAKHSKSHHQQYSDFIRSKMYKNDITLVTCSECHEVHSYPRAHQLHQDPTNDMASCGGCHEPEAKNLSAHIDKYIAGTGALMAKVAHCVDCHMPKTAKSGAGAPGLKIGQVQFWQGDIASHKFDMPKKAASKADASGLPTAYTNACGSCHTKSP